jgi:hypothetical protein
MVGQEGRRNSETARAYSQSRQDDEGSHKRGSKGSLSELEEIDLAQLLMILKYTKVLKDLPFQLTEPLNNLSPNKVLTLIEQSIYDERTE